jgi:hypothetical protein
VTRTHGAIELLEIGKHRFQGFLVFTGQLPCQSDGPDTGMDVVKQFYSDYADQPTGHQDEITNKGKAYLDKNFPKLDSIKTAVIVTAPAAADPAAAAAKPKD